MSSFQIGALAQLIHVTGDLPAAEKLYLEVFGGTRFYEGYSPFEKRDASIIAIGNFTIEPMAPANEDGAEQMPVGRFFSRFGSHLHSIALNVKGVPDLYERLIENNVRVVGPGGTDASDLPAEAPMSIYTHPKDSHCLLEFVDFGPDFMMGSPRLEPDWDPTQWRDRHPLGVDGPSHITVVVRDLEVATTFFTDVLDCTVFHEVGRTLGGTTSRFLLIGTETVIELAQPVDGGTRAAIDLQTNGEIVHAVTLRVVDLDRAAKYLSENHIGLARRSGQDVVLHPESCGGAVIRLTEEDLPNDPRDLGD